MRPGRGSPSTLLRDALDAARPRFERELRKALDRTIRETAARTFTRSAGKHETYAAFVWAIEQVGLPKPQREFRFHPLRKFRADFAWPDHMILLEVDGGLWQKGGTGHSHPMHIKRDMEKQNAAALLGYRTLRYMPEQLGKAIDDLRIILAR